jgi:hypothetical protein
MVDEERVFRELMGEDENEEVEKTDKKEEEKDKNNK